MPYDLVGMGGPGNLSERDRERGPSVAHDASSHRLDSGSSANPAAPPQHPDRIKSPPSWNEAPSNALPLSLRYSMDAKYKKGFWWFKKKQQQYKEKNEDQNKKLKWKVVKLNIFKI